MTQYLVQESRNDKTAINGSFPRVLERNGGDFKA